MGKTAQIAVRGEYSLAASASFLCGFTPASGSGATLDDGRLVIGFLDETTYEPVIVAVAQDEDGEVTFDGGARLEKQVARILSLDHDGTALRAIAERDPVIASLVREMPGFRPVCFPSPYEAAVWGILAQRIPMTMASRIKQRLALFTGSVAEGFGRTFLPAPPPRAILALDRFDGLPEEKLLRMKGVAAAALEGRLDAERLRSMAYEDAHAELRSLRGIGQWTADHVLVRGTGLADELPVSEPRVLRGIAEAYGLPATPSDEEAFAIAEKWRPLRTWISVMLVSKLSRTDGWRGPPRRRGDGTEPESRGRKRPVGGVRKAAPSHPDSAPSPRARVAAPRSGRGSAA